MSASEKSQTFKGLHVPGNPLILYNVWDAGSAAAVAAEGAKAIATGSWSVAAAQGYADGEKIPLSELVKIAQNIVHAVDLPCTIDFEGAYAESPLGVAENALTLMDVGAVGINFEDQRVGGEGLYEVAEQCKRIAAIRSQAEVEGHDFFINARTDIFLKAGANEGHESLMGHAKERAKAYADAGASGYFVPGLMDADLIAEICEVSALPVNVMMKKGVPSVAELAELGVARVSHGPGPYVQAMKNLRGAASALYSE